MDRTAHLSNATLAYEIGGSGPLLVWCHGLASCRDGDRDYIEAFQEHFTVLSYDARGHGRSSPVRDESLFTYPELSRDLVELIEFVGWDSALLAGSSMGAATAIRVGMERPEIPIGLFALRPGSDGSAAPQSLQALFRLGAAAIRNGGLDEAIEFLMTIPQARDAIEKDPNRLDGLRRDWERHDPHSIAAALEGIPASAPLTPDLDPASLLVPLLVIAGNDAIHPPAAAEQVAAKFPTARAMPPLNALTREDETQLILALLIEFARECEMKVRKHA
ncbi:MAG: alpha/beta fold hydrolase [Actinomycetota bacterium]